MKFVKNHLTKHHLLHAPHRWFLAFLISPIHVLEIHYQKQYHLQFAHARKLFLFDFVLIISIVALAITTAFWYWYDPTILEHIDLSINASEHPDTTPEQDKLRIRSGEHLYYSIHITNRSDKELIEPTLIVNFPPGFVLAGVDAPFTTSSRSLSFPAVKPRQEKIITLNGSLFGEPDKDYVFGTQLVYRQPHRENFEVKTTSFIITPRGSILEGSIKNPPEIFAKSTWTADLVLHNTYHHTLPMISVPLKLNNQAVSIRPINHPSFGTLDNNIWKITSLAPQQFTTMTLQFSAQLSKEIKTVQLFLTPQLQINQEIIPQTPIGNTINVAHPEISVSGSWTEKKSVLPGESAMLQFQIKNSGDTDARDVTITIPLPNSIVNQQQFSVRNKLPIRGSGIIISSKEKPGLKVFPRGATESFSLIVPINQSATGGKNLTFIPHIVVTGRAHNLSDTFTSSADLSALNIGTHLKLKSEARYYSSEGDQLGRGSLPPRVGKETKYWALLEITNATSDVKNLTISATLPSFIQWTGKTSVSRGREPQYNPDNRTMTWETSSLSAFDSAHISFEVSLTPTNEQVGSTPLLVTNLKATAYDTFIDRSITTSGKNLNASLPTDTKAQQKGVVVE